MKVGGIGWERGTPRAAGYRLQARGDWRVRPGSVPDQVPAGVAFSKQDRLSARPVYQACSLYSKLALWFPDLPQPQVTDKLSAPSER